MHGALPGKVIKRWCVCGLTLSLSDSMNPAVVPGQWIRQTPNTLEMWAICQHGQSAYTTTTTTTTTTFHCNVYYGLRLSPFWLIFFCYLSSFFVNTLSMVHSRDACSLHYARTILREWTCSFWAYFSIFSMHWYRYREMYTIDTRIHCNTLHTSALYT